jgi:hypothetical protein
MKSPLLAGIVALQLLCVGLLIGLLMRPSGKERDAELSTLAAKIEGSINQQRLILGYLDQLRAQAARAAAATGEAASGSAPEGATGGESATAGGATGSPRGPEPPDSPFPLAAEALEGLATAFRNRAAELDRGTNNIGPLDTELQKRRSALIARGHEAIWVVQHEIDLQPYEPGRDVALLVYLLDEIVPPLSAAAKDDAFSIARSALGRATNEAQVKFAAAKALRAIDSAKWVKDVCDVIAMGSTREIGLRGQLLGMFAETPKPEAVELCVRFMEDARQPPELRTRAIQVIQKQDGSAVDPALRRVLFEEPFNILKNHSLDGLLDRMADPDAKRRLLEQVLDEDGARMPDSVREKARQILDSLGK